MATTIAERIAQRKGSMVPLMSRFVSKHPFGAKSGLAFEKLATMKSGNVDSAAKVALGPVHPTYMTDSFVEKEKSTHVDSYEKSTKSVYEEFPEICALLKVDLFEDVNVYTKFVNSVVKVFRSNYFKEHPAYSRMSSLLTTMQNILILVVESMRLIWMLLKLPRRSRRC